MTYWHASKYPVRPGDKVRHDRHGFGIVIENDRKTALVRFDRYGTEPKKVDAWSMSFIAKPTAESLQLVEMTRKAKAQRDAYVAEAREAARLRAEQAA